MSQPIRALASPSSAGPTCALDTVSGAGELARVERLAVEGESRLEENAVDVRAGVDRSAVGHVVTDRDVRAAHDALELERGATRAREGVQPDRHFREGPHPLVV